MSIEEISPDPRPLDSEASESAEGAEDPGALPLLIGFGLLGPVAEASVVLEMALGVLPFLGPGVNPSEDLGWGFGVDLGFGVEAFAGLGVDLGFGAVGIAGIFSGSASAFSNSSILAPQFSQIAKESSISKWHLGQVHI